MIINEQLIFPTATIVIRFVFEKDGKFFARILLDECLYELKKSWNTIELMFQRERILMKQAHQKNVCFVIIDILKMLVKSLNRMFVMVVAMYWWLLIN